MIPVPVVEKRRMRVMWVNLGEREEKGVLHTGSSNESNMGRNAFAPDREGGGWLGGEG